MRQLQILAPGRAALRHVPTPAPGPGQVLLRVEAVTTCPHWDRHIMAGIPMFADRPLSYPYTPGEPGHEAVGRVAALGARVAGLQTGDRVAAWRDPGGRAHGCYGEYAVLSAEDLLRVPDGLPDEALAPLELAMCVQVSFDQLLGRGPLAGLHVGISGAGPAGLIAMQLARAYGAARVTAFDLLPARRTRALTLGADAALHPEEHPEGRDHEDAFDAAVDTTGVKAAIEHLMARTRRTVAIFGVLREEVTFGPAQWWGDFALLGYGAHGRAAAERALEHVVAGRLDLAALVTHTLPADRYAEAVALLEKQEAVKVMFRF